MNMAAVKLNGKGLAACLSLIIAFTCRGPADTVAQDFQHPPTSAAARVYWMWLRTPTSHEAITRDLEAMKAKGIAGFILYDSGAGGIEKPNRKIVAGDKEFKLVPTGEFKGEFSTALPMLQSWTPAWREEIRFVASESKRLGLEFCLTCGLAGCSAPGLDPQYAQQVLDWSQKEVSGHTTFDAVLPLPSTKAMLLNPDKTPMHLEVAVLAVPVKAAINPSDVRDISSSMDNTGHLHWEVPAGSWRILRFIQRPINHTAAGWGYFCDTLSTEGFDQDWALTMAPLLAEMTPDERAGLQSVEDDSWESGKPNWTKTFPEEFQKRRGYSAITYLPALAGQTMVDAATTERIKQDFKQTVSDLIVDHYYHHMTEVCHQNGLTLYCEADGPHLEVADIVSTGAQVDHNMGEFWMPSPHRPTVAARFLTRDAASCNHLYGKTVTMCESFTSVGPVYEETPFSIKACADQAFTDGTNCICIHNYSHSPLLDDKPGDLYFAGTHINRNLTWWDEAPAFFGYLSRCCAMLQEGRFVADALFYIGDGINKDAPTRVNPPTLGDGYDYDRADRDVLLKLASVKDGRIVLSTGMSYRVLILPEKEPMPLDALEKISTLVEAGAKVVGPKPTGLYGLAVPPEDEKKFNDLVEQLWGQGRINAGKTAQQLLLDEGVPADFSFGGLSPQGEIAWIHRSTDASEIYYVASRWFAPEKLTCKFRVTGRQPELWDPVTGTMRDATAFQQENGQTILPLDFDACGSVFVVFRKPIAPTAAGPTRSNSPTLQPLGQIAGPWTVAFDPKWGGPAQPVTFETLTDWSKSPDDGIKYFSGTAVYTKKFDLPATPPPGQQLLLDLGEVHEVASVHLNGHDLGVVWMHPGRVDITSAVKPTGNELEIKVVNLWPNRLIGTAFCRPKSSLPRPTCTTSPRRRRSIPPASSGQFRSSPQNRPRQTETEFSFDEKTRPGGGGITLQMNSLLGQSRGGGDT